MKNDSVTIKIEVNPDTLAEIDLMATRLSLVSGLDWDTASQTLERTLGAFSKPFIAGATNILLHRVLPNRN